MSSGPQTNYYPAPTREKDMNGGVDTTVEMGRIEKQKPVPNNVEKPAKDLTVFYSGDTSHRPRPRVEKYLLALCVLLFVACIIFIAIAFTRDGSDSASGRVCLTEHCVKTAAQLLDAIDPSADPCEDFFQYACGAWNRKHIIPADKSSFNTFEKLHDELQVKLKRLLEAPKNNYDTNATVKAKVLFKSCMNTTQVERVGDDPLREVLLQLGGWPVVHAKWDQRAWNLENSLGKLRGSYNNPVLLKTMVATDDKNSSVRVLQALGGWPVVNGHAWNLSSWKFEHAIGQLRGSYNCPIFVDSWVSTDDKISTRHIIQIDQPGLGMPSREYYLKSKDDEYKQAYLKYMVNVAMLLGANRSFAVSEMTDVLDFEIKLANVTTPQAERHDTGAMYKKLTIRELQELVPQINWLMYFNSFMPTPINSDEQIVSLAMGYLGGMAELVTRQSNRVLANYLVWRLILGLTPEMTEKYQRERNEYRRVLQGVSRDKMRWQKCVEYVNDRMGMAVGRLFVRDYFQKESKDTALEMIHNLREAFNEILDENGWMDDETKAVAKEKAYAMNERIGYPEFILDQEELDRIYERLSFRADHYFDNILIMERFDSNRNMRKLRQPVNKNKWEQDPAVVNAFYNPNTNDIVFPAGILQPLFYSQHFPKSLNYGGIGVVIGHEMTHGFDDKGRQYDKDGNMREWWNNRTIDAFRERAQCMIDQYSRFKLEPFGLPIDGKNTQGENIADNGGLKESFRAYRKWVERNGEEQALPGVDLNHNQLFFLNYAQIWCGIMRDEEALHKIRTSVHSPGPIRVLGPLSNSKDFADAYHCPAGSRMNPVEKCCVW